MGWLILWGIVAAYLAIGARRMPTYYRRWYDHDRKEWHTIHTIEESQRAAAWHAIGLGLFWPYYEGARWMRDTVIRHMTAEERAQAEFKQAERIVAEYKARKEREERDEFDRRLNEG